MIRILRLRENEGVKREGGVGRGEWGVGSGGGREGRGKIFTSRPNETEADGGLRTEKRDGS